MEGLTSSESWRERTSRELYERGGIRPYYSDDSCIVLLGDCRELLPHIGPVDLVLTDPPYGVGYVTARRSRTDPLVAPIAGDESLNLLADAMPLLDRLLRQDRHAYFFSSARKIGQTCEIVADYWKVKNVLVWDKGDAGSVGDLDAGYGVTWEGIVYANKGRRSLIGPRPRTVYRYEWSGTRDPVHPTVKPVGVLTWLASKSSEPGETILDPFMGSGTTLRAAKDLGRKAIGIEIEERYAEIAAKRLQQSVLPMEIPA